MSYELLYCSDFNGHHLFRDMSNGRLVIADHSNDDQHGESDGPVGCDDGVLYVDFTRSVQLYKSEIYTLPLISQEGKESTCLSRLAEVHRIEALEARRFK